MIMCMEGEGFEKIDLESDTSPKPQVQTQRSRMTMRNKTTKKPLTIGGIIIAVVVLFLIFGVAIPGFAVYSQAKKAYAQAKITLAAAKQENIVTASDELDKTRVELDKTKADLSGMGYLAFIPLVNFYYSDAYHGLQAASYAMDAAKTTIEAIKPYADVIGLKGQGSFVGGSAQDRIKTAVTTLDKVTPAVDKISASLAQAKTEIDQVDPNHYPAFLVGSKIHNTIVSSKTLADETISFMNEAKPLVKQLPSLLGEPTRKQYLVLFQNDAELRPTGGFETAYAIFSVEHGVIRAEKSEDIYTLDGTIPNKPAAPRILAQYLPLVPQFNIRDANTSPDFIVSMNQFYKMYQTAGVYTPIDGIIGIDTYPLVSAIDILGGEVDAGGQIFTTKHNPTCNCPQVIYDLENSADRPVNYVRSDRKSAIGDLMLAIMNKAFASAPKLYWGKLIQDGLVANTVQKHILFYFFNTDAQQGMLALNASGQIKDYAGDYLHVNDANYGGAKANLFVKEQVTQDYSFQSDGSIVKTVTINYKNPYPPSDCNLEHGNLCLNAILRDLVRIYVPKGSVLMSNKGSEVKMLTYDDLGKTVFEGFTTVRPLGTTTYSVSYKLPFKLQNGSPLPALYQKQPGTNDNLYTVTVNGNQIQQFNLLQDTEVKINH